MSIESNKMKSLAVFDFDRTMILDDSDATIISKLGTPPPRQNDEWTPYMENVFEHAYSAGLKQDDILAAIASMRPTPGIQELVGALAAAGWDILLLTDANSVFVQHWLKEHHLEHHITSVITNRAFWRHGRLFIEPCMSQSACERCPTNLCKSLALAQWCAARDYRTIVYAGDGRNDFCPATNLPEHATVFPRKDYPMHQLIKKSAGSASQVLAKVVPWEDAYRILDELFPGRDKIHES